MDMRLSCRPLPPSPRSVTLSVWKWPQGLWRPTEESQRASLLSDRELREPPRPSPCPPPEQGLGPGQRL